jgi:hypothetical protein
MWKGTTCFTALAAAALGWTVMATPVVADQYTKDELRLERSVASIARENATRMHERADAQHLENRAASVERATAMKRGELGYAGPLEHRTISVERGVRTN